MNNCITSSSFILYTTLVSIVLIKDLNKAEKDLLGNFFQLLGQNIVSALSYDNNIEELCFKNDN
jgi:hypothetical protein